MADASGGAFSGFSLSALTSTVKAHPVMTLAAVGAGAFLLWKSGLLAKVTGGSTTSTTAATTTAAPATATAQAAPATLSAEIGLLQQLQSFQQASYQDNLQQVQQTQQTAAALNPPPAAASPTITGISGQSGTPGGPGSLGGIPVYSSANDSSGYTLAPFGTQFQVTGALIPGGAYGGFYPVSVPGGGSGYVHGTDVGALSGGAGGGRGGAAVIPPRIHSVTGRNRVGAADPIFRAGHPMIRTGSQTYPHYAVGGPRSAMGVAAATGLHPARVLAVNGGMRRGAARPNQIVRVV